MPAFSKFEWSVLDQRVFERLAQGPATLQELRAAVASAPNWSRLGDRLQWHRKAGRLTVSRRLWRIAEA